MNRTGFVADMHAPPTLAAVVAYLDEHLSVKEIADYPGALNGLQLENDGTVTRFCAAVDASLTTVRAAAHAGRRALLLVHHGLFWSGLQPMTGNRRALFKCAFDGNLAVYGAHLPIDTGAQGNSFLLARACLPDTDWQPFFNVKGTLIGCRATLETTLSRAAIAERVSAAVGWPVRICPGGPGMAREVGVISGGAGSEARQVAGEGIDTLITGEGPHWTYALAEELGLNILYGGHYATETFAVRALAQHLSERYCLPWQFIDAPSGL